MPSRCSGEGCSRHNFTALPAGNYTVTVGTPLGPYTMRIQIVK